MDPDPDQGGDELPRSPPDSPHPRRLARAPPPVSDSGVYSREEMDAMFDRTGAEARFHRTYTTVTGGGGAMRPGEYGVEALARVDYQLYCDPNMKVVDQVAGPPAGMVAAASASGQTPQQQRRRKRSHKTGGIPRSWLSSSSGGPALPQKHTPPHPRKRVIYKPGVDPAYMRPTVSTILRVQPDDEARSHTPLPHCCDWHARELMVATNVVGGGRTLHRSGANDTSRTVGGLDRYSDGGSGLVSPLFASRHLAGHVGDGDGRRRGGNATTGGGDLSQSRSPAGAIRVLVDAGGRKSSPVSAKKGKAKRSTKPRVPSTPPGQRIVMRDPLEALAGDRATTGPLPPAVLGDDSAPLPRL